METSWRQRVAALATQPEHRTLLLESLKRELPGVDGSERLEMISVMAGLELALGHWDEAVRRAGELSALAGSLERTDQEATARLQAARALEAQGRLRTAADVLDQVRRLCEVPALKQSETGTSLRLKAAAIAARIAARRGQARYARHLASQLARQELPDDPELHAARIYDDLDPAGLASVLLQTREPLLAAALAEVAGRTPPFDAVQQALSKLGRSDLAATFEAHRFRMLLAEGQALEVLEAIDGLSGTTPEWVRATLAVEEIRAAMQLGDAARALTASERHLQVLTSLGFDAHTVLVRLETARAHGRLGRLPQAREALEQGLATAVTLGQEALAATVTLELASVLRALGETQEAARHLNGLELQIPAVQARRGLLLAHLALDVGTPGPAERSALQDLAKQARSLGLELHARALEERLAL